MGRVTADAQSSNGPPLTAMHAGSQALTEHLYAHVVDLCNLPHIERSVKLQNILRKNNCLFGLHN